MKRERFDTIIVKGHKRYSVEREVMYEGDFRQETDEQSAF